MTTTKTPVRDPHRRRVSRFTYAIRNIVAEAQQVEAAGRTVRYLNIGDPVAFGFQTPPHLIDAVERAHARRPQQLRTFGRHPGGARSGRRRIHAARIPGHAGPRRSSRRAPRKGSSWRSARSVDDGDEVLVPMPTYPLYTAVLAKLGARARTIGPTRRTAGCPISITSRASSRPRTRALVVIDPNNPTGAVYPTRRPTRRCSTSPTARAARSSPTRCTAISAYEGPRRAAGQPRSRRADHLVLEPVEGLSRARLAHRLDGGRPLAAAGRRRGRAMRKLADGRLCSTVPMQYAIAGGAERGRVAPGGVPRRAARARSDLTIVAFECDARRHAASRRPPRSTPCRECAACQAGPMRTYVLALLRATGVLCVYGSGFGLPADRRIPAHRLPRIARRAQRDLRSDGEFHSTIPRVKPTRWTRSNRRHDLVPSVVILV